MAKFDLLAAQERLGQVKVSVVAEIVVVASTGDDSVLATLRCAEGKRGTQVYRPVSWVL